MWTDLVFNLFLLAIACADATTYFFILAVSNCGYIIFNFLNLNAGWIHRIDNGHVARPFKAPTFISALGAIFAFVNAMFMGAGAKVWNPMALWAGLIAAALIIPVFCFRHYVQDKGKFPPHMLDGSRHEAVRPRGAQGGHAALPDAGRRRRGGADRELDLRDLTGSETNKERVAMRRALCLSAASICGGNWPSRAAAFPCAARRR